MGKIQLKNIIGKKTEACFIIGALIEKLGASIYIEDENKKIILGDLLEETKYQCPIEPGEEIVGWVNGDENATIIASLISVLVKKEMERKSLGSEVLNLYQEVNLIFNFSEKLAQTIEPAAISNIALEEARHLIKSDSGIIVLWDEYGRQLQVAASSGSQLFDEKKINTHLDLLLKISLSGLSEIMGDVSLLKEDGLIDNRVQSVIYAALKVKHRVMGAIILASCEAVTYSAGNLKFLTTLALQSSSAIESAMLYEKNIREVKEREEALRRIYEVTNKFVPYEFIGSLGHQLITDIRLGDQVEKIVTVLFSDIRDYTTLAEQMSPEENFRFVSSFNEIMGPIIRKHNGFINQYLGDAIMAIFPGNASEALTAAVEMQKAVETFNEKRLLSNLPPIQTGLGMHTGPLIMGITGDAERLDATTIADAVNTASRLESLTKYYKSNIILSEDTYSQISNQQDFHLRHLGMVQLKGKQKAISIYECFSGNKEDEKKYKSDTLDVFNEGMSYYLNKSFVKASHAFESLLKVHPKDHTAIFFLKNAKRFIDTGVPENWSGVEEMVNK